MKRLATALVAALGLVGCAEAKRGFFQQEESAQHLLQAEGDTFRFFRHNLICSNWEYASFDSRDKTDAEPSLHLSDSSGTEGVALRSHNPVACQPFTRYRLRFKSKLNSFEKGPPPIVEISLYDFNRDFIRSLAFEIPATDAGKGWLDKRFEFATPHDGHALMASFESRGQTVCDIVFDEAYVEQVSAAGALRPESRIVVSAPKVRSGEAGSAALRAGEGACIVSFEFAWTPGPAGQSLVFEWLDARGRVLGAETCRFSTFEGVRAEWSGVQAEWFRKYNDTADKVRRRRDRFYNAAGAAGSGELDVMLPRPEDAATIRVRLAEVPGSRFEVKNLVVKAQPLDIPVAERTDA